MKISFFDILDEARTHGGAAGAFTCYDLETAEGVLEVARVRDRPVILLVGPASILAPGGESFLAAICAYVERHRARACVQVDHVGDLALVSRAFELGAGAAMVDGSQLQLDDNLALVRAAVELAADFDGGIEAELGRIEGDEDIATAARSGKLTDPEEAQRFVAQTDVACLAISIGNAHGRYTSRPHLDWDRLTRIRSLLSVPLSLHGASGIPSPDVRRAVRAGIVKVNVNTELRDAYLSATAEQTPAALPTAAVHALHRAQTDAVAEIVSAKLVLYEPASVEPGDGSLMS
jgi:tagatose 1,6-diphosphate aldolase GatY/KbaY